MHAIARAILLTAVGSLTFSSTVWATDQSPDILIIEGKETEVCAFLLEEYFEVYPEKRPEPGWVLTSLGRGYIATFSLNAGHLFISNIEIFVTEGMPEDVGPILEIEYMKLKSVIDSVFQTEADRSMAWFSGNVDVLDTFPAEESAAEPFVTQRKRLQFKEGVLMQSTIIGAEEHGEGVIFICT